MEELKKQLHRAGYTHVNYVDRPCTYATRGGIVDIFPYNMKNQSELNFLIRLLNPFVFLMKSLKEPLKKSIKFKLDQQQIYCFQMNR